VLPGYQSFSLYLFKSLSSSHKFLKRPGTADSVMSHLSSLSALERPLTSTFCLPKMNGIFGSVLPPIKEQEATEQPSTILRPISPDSRQSIKPHSVTNFDFDALSCHSNEKEVEEVHEVTRKFSNFLKS